MLQITRLWSKLGLPRVSLGKGLHLDTLGNKTAANGILVAVESSANCADLQKHLYLTGERLIDPTHGGCNEQDWLQESDYYVVC